MTEEAAEIEEPAEILKKCFRNQNELYYGHVKRDENKENGWIRHGLGKLISTKGDEQNPKGRVILSHYEGWFENNEITGQGQYTFQDGSVFTGQFIQSIPNGSGKMVWPDGAVYEGGWVNGQMHGQGRFVAEQGDYREGEFQQNRFNFRGTWIDILDDVIKVRELENLLKGDGDVDKIPVTFCLPDTPHLLDAIETTIMRENLVPFIVRDPDLDDYPSVLLQEDEENASYHMGHVVVRRRRHQDYQSPLYERVRKSIQKGGLFSLIIGGNEEKSWGDSKQAVPADWNIEQWHLDSYFDRCSLPVEIFNPKVFSGRPDLQAMFVEPENYGDICRFCIVGTPLNQEVTMDKQLIREEVVERFGYCVPLHRCAIIVLTSLN